MAEFTGIAKMLPALEAEDVERLLGYVEGLEDLGSRLDQLMEFVELHRPDLRSIVAAIARSYKGEGEATVEAVTTGILTFLLLMDRAWADLYGDAWPVH
ncbi:MAG: hypothetical protein V3T41_07710 [bacterium]|jgi:hypothetical protein